MPQVISTDTSQFIPTDAQSVHGNIQARKHLKIKTLAKVQSVELSLLAACESPRKPLTVRINDRPAGTIDPSAGRGVKYQWYSLPIKTSLLKSGVNRIALSCPDGRWDLPLTTSPARSTSYRSDDGGKTWLNRHLGRYHAVTGEYILRLRLEDNRAERFPRFVYENDKTAQLADVRAALPASVKKPAAAWPQAQRLSSHIARTLRYFNSHDAANYTPWDYFEILHDNAVNIAAQKAGKPISHIVMCVHFTVAFVQAATALGLRTRCMVSTQGIGTGNGHFFPEVFLPETNTWAMIDPTVDAWFVDENDQPLSAMAIHANREHLSDALRLGSAAKSLGERQKGFIQNSIKNGSTYANLAYWRRTDFFSYPQFCPTYHGAITYYESDLVWIAGDDPLISAFVYDYRGFDE